MNSKAFFSNKIKRLFENVDTVGVCPYGYWGKQVANILMDSGKKVVIFDNFVKPIGDTARFVTHKVIDLVNYDSLKICFACNNGCIYTELINEVKKYKKNEDIIELFPRFSVGKHSYGPICECSTFVNKIGAFCSFAENSSVVGNHDVYISSHEFLSYPGEWDNHPGHIMNSIVKRPRIINKSTIGNDVWVGRNSVIISGNDIGNGVIIGANSTVTCDIPDYAVAVGSPARIIKYRYTQKQIDDLNKIAWWNWTDEKIISCVDDFYLGIDEFIMIHEND